MGRWVRLLEIFAKHLSVMANQINCREAERGVAPLSAGRRALSASIRPNRFQLDQMSQTLNVSTFYFCKMFKKATGLTFTDYLARTRIERAK